MTKTEALERIRRAVEEKCDQHGHIDHGTVGDVLTILVGELLDEEADAVTSEQLPG
jgi:hypothetical protein